jgi:hypothetical protein
VTIAGRALAFPANTPLAGSTVELFEVHPGTGARTSAQPEATFTIDQSGDFGPVPVNGSRHYEMTLRSEEGFTQHFYFQPFVRDNHLLRLLQSPSNSALAQAIDRSPNHSTVVIERQKEFWGDNPLEGTVDVVDVSTKTAGGPNQPPVNIVNPATAAFTENFVLALVTWDEGSDGVTDTSGQIPVATFLSTIDVFYPAASPPDGTITVDMLTRGESKRQVLNAPNWASTEHGVTMKFRSWAQDVDTWAACKRLKPSPCK